MNEATIKQYAFFPTVVSKAHINSEFYDKEDIFDAVMSNLNKNGQSMDFLGTVLAHHDKRLDNIFTIINDTVAEHLNTLNINSDNFDINIVKSWFNIINNNVNTIHDHAEAHYSFTFYPHISSNSNRVLRFHTTWDQPNEPIPGFFKTTCNEYNAYNAGSWTIPINEGDICVFPSKLLHDTIDLESIDNNNIIAPVITSKEMLKDTRICLAGDVILTHKTLTGNHKALQPISTWKKF